MVRKGSRGGRGCAEVGRGLSEMGVSPEAPALCLAQVCTLEGGGAGHGLLAHCICSWVGRREAARSLQLSRPWQDLPVSSPRGSRVRRKCEGDGRVDGQTEEWQLSGDRRRESRKG